MATPGPNSKTTALEDTLGPIPGPPVDVGEGVALDQLTPEQIRARLAARERDIKYHVAALKHEATTVLDDVNVGGRPLMDLIRQRKPIALGAGAAVGAVVGILLGLRARSKRKPAPSEDHVEFVRARLALALDRAAERVARGASVDQAHAGVDGHGPRRVRRRQGAAAAPPPRLVTGRPRSTWLVQTAIGFGVKTAMDYWRPGRWTDSEGSARRGLRRRSTRPGPRRPRPGR